MRTLKVISAPTDPSVYDGGIEPGDQWYDTDTGVTNIPIAVFYKAVIAGAVTGIDGDATLQIKLGTMSVMLEVNQGAGSEVSILLANVATNHALKGGGGYSQTPGALTAAAITVAASNVLDFTGGDAGNSLAVTVVYVTLTV